MIARALMLAIATGAAGCSLFLLDGGFTSGDDDAAALAEGGSDAPVDPSDGASVTDAPGSEANPDAPTVPFCDTIVPKATFCDDFNRTELMGAWSDDFITAGTSLTLEPNLGGRSLLASMPAITMGTASET